MPNRLNIASVSVNVNRTEMRRVAANWVYRAPDRVLRQAVVELSGAYVVNYYPIEDELPATEWLGGAFFLSAEEDPEWPESMTLEDVKRILLSEEATPRYVYHLRSDLLQKEILSPSFLLCLAEED